MLSAKYLNNLGSGIIAQYEDMTLLIIKDMARRIVKLGEITDSSHYQFELLKQSTGIKNDIIDKISKENAKTSKEIERIFIEACAESQAFSIELYKKAGIDALPISKSPGMMQILLAGLEKTKGNIDNWTKTTASYGQDAFLKAANQAYLMTANGAISYSQAIRQAVFSLADKGVRCVNYDSGVRNNVDVAVRRALLTGVNQTAAEITLLQAEELGSDLVETSAHAGARPTHAVWQGEVYSLSGTHSEHRGFYQATGYGSGDGLCGWNCRHSFYVFIEGVSVKNYTPQKLLDYENQTVKYNSQSMTLYDATQIQRKYERQIRDSKRRLNAIDAAKRTTTDSDLKSLLNREYQKASAKLKDRRSTLSDLFEQTGLYKNQSLEQVPGFGVSEAQRARRSAEAKLRKTN